MRLVVFGGRDLSLSVFALDHWLGLFGYTPSPELTIIEGEARGVDTSARRWAEHHGTGLKKHFANWRMHERAAGPIRNAVMVRDCDRGVGFITSGSRGTLDMYRQMSRAGKHVDMVGYEFLPDRWDGTEETL